jgi:hypothetical protein
MVNKLIRISKNGIRGAEHDARRATWKQRFLRRRALACVAKPAGPLEPVDGSIAGFGGEEEAVNCQVTTLLRIL